jgi:hypothetical protein
MPHSIVADKANVANESNSWSVVAEDHHGKSRPTIIVIRYLLLLLLLDPWLDGFDNNY